MNGPWGWLLLAVVLEIGANIMLKASDGFRRRGLALVSVGCVWLAFAALAEAVRFIPLPVAYAAWGALGVLATSLAGSLLFGQRMTRVGWLGMGLVMGGLVVLNVGL